MEKHVYIVRHGETEYNRKGIIQGKGVDSSLNETGKLQAAAFYRHHQSADFQLVMTSTLKRTWETMKPFIDSGLPWERFSDINEIDWGIHEGKASSPEMHAEYKKITTAWSDGDYHAGVEGGETAAQMGERLSRFVEVLLKRPEDKILVCSHGRAMRALICLLKQQPLRVMNNYKHSNTGLYQMAHGQGNIHFLLENDLSHLSQDQKILI